MGTYPERYSQPAIIVATRIVESVVERLVIKNDGRWEVEHFALSKDELQAIRWRFEPGVKDASLVSLVGLVFSKTFPAMHYKLISNCYQLAPDEKGGIGIVEDPPSTRGYKRSPKAQAAAFNLVRALIDWRSVDSSWSDFIGEGRGNSDLIYGSLYTWLKDIGEFTYCRPRDVIEFIYAALPDLHDEWRAEGLELVPRYHAENDGTRRRFITLRLSPIAPA